MALREKSVFVSYFEQWICEVLHHLDNQIGYFKSRLSQVSCVHNVRHVNMYENMPLSFKSPSFQ